jgi:Glyoxalase-like domain
MRIRQIVFAARNLAHSREQLASLLGLTGAFRDPGVAEFGIDNAVFSLGDQFIEVISPTQPGTACGRHIERHGDSPYMLILQTDNLAREESRLDTLGVRRVWRSADFDNISGTHLHPKDIGGAIVSIDEARPAASWRWGGPLWQTGAAPMSGLQVRQRVRGLQLRAPDPKALALRWAQVLGLAPPVAAAKGWRLGLLDGWAEFESAEEADPTSRITSFSLEVASVPAVLARARQLGLPVQGDSVTVMGAVVALSSTD